MEQDIFATVYLFNIIHDVLEEEEQNLNANKSNYKYEVHLNKNIAIGIIKEELITFVLQSNTQKQQDIMDAIYDEISSHVVPVRQEKLFTFKW